MRTLKPFLIAWALGLLLAFESGCGASWFSASTESCYETEKVKVCYKSTKNQENFSAKLGLNPDGTLKDLDIKTTATTAESAIAAAMQSVTALMDTFRELIPLLTKAAATGGS